MTQRTVTVAVVATLTLLMTACGGSSEPPTPDDPASGLETRSGTTGIAGVVKDAATSRAIAGAVVSDGSRSATTATDGSYRLSESAGTYTFTVRKSGYGSASKTVTVSRYQTTTVNWSLSPSTSGGDDGSPTPTPTPTPTGSGFKVFANNDLGMHCVDKSFAVFSILPPYNVVDAQVVALQSSGKPLVLDATQVAVRYSAVADATGSINSTSVGKSDFWQFVQQLYGAALPAGEGLQGLWMPADAPSAAGTTLAWDTALGLFKAPGIPIFPVDDRGQVNRYPLMRFSAYDKSGSALASTDVVLPVSEETSCQTCHATGQVAAPAGAQAWSTDPDLENQARRNVLILHNARTGTTLQAPVLCATYQCHPGASTQCLRGAMTSKLDCQNCHGNMAAVGGAYPLLAGGSIDGTNDGKARRPWLDLPRCQSCHANDATSKTSLANPPQLASDGLRFSTAFVPGDASASPILATNKRFAEEPGKLYRKSKGHGGLACEACHGSTHAIWTANANDNVAATELQGHSGTISECSTCHQAAPTNGLGGPHGMHPVGSSWVSSHQGIAESSRTSCQPCHGADYRGTVLSRMFVTRTLAGKTFTAGTVIGCYSCHNGPNP